MNAAIAFLALAVAADPSPNVVTVTVEPAELTLSHPRFGHRLLVTGIDNAGRAHDLTAEAVWSARDKHRGRGAERPDCTARQWTHGGERQVAGKRLEVPVRVNGFQADPRVSLRQEVVPVLTKAGCNAGACHGAQYGKGGFTLSLFGGDPNTDHSAMVRDALGRRINVIEPGGQFAPDEAEQPGQPPGRKPLAQGHTGI